jgi:hypothetical protein
MHGGLIADGLFGGGSANATIWMPLFKMVQRRLCRLLQNARARQMPRQYQENHHEELSGVREYDDPSIQAQGHYGENNSCHDLRQAVSLPEM